MSALNLTELAIHLLAAIGGEIPLQLKQALGALRCGNGSAVGLLNEAMRELKGDPYPPRRAVAEIVGRACELVARKIQGGRVDV